MKLIFVTRKVDFVDPRTSFVFGWLNKFASELEELNVICLEKGDTTGLSKNIFVYSMGKELGKSRFRELKNYIKHLKRLVPNSDGVFIHMHPIYAIVAWFFTRKPRKKLALWYTHK